MSFQNKKFDKINKLISKLKVKFESFDKLKQFTVQNEKEFALILEHFFAKVQKEEVRIKDPIGIRKLKNLFRSDFSRFINKSLLVRHGLNKPRGYPGDASIIEVVYNNKPKSAGMGLLIDKYFLSDPYIQAIRDRKDHTKFFLKRYILTSKKKVPDILNVACGSCREIRELCAEGVGHIKGARIKFVDQDLKTLKHAQKNLELFKDKIHCKFICENVARFYTNKVQYTKILGKQDLIYSIGLADYLPDSILGPLIRFLYERLRKGGVLFLAHKNITEYPELVADWFCDWKFIPRSKNEFNDIVKSNLSPKDYSAEYSWSKSKLLFYAVIKKVK